MDNCIICLESNNDDIFSRITTQSSEWIEGSIQRIIEKHLWWWYFKPSDECEQWICRNCWQEISSFHNFYLKVEMVHHHQLSLKSLVSQEQHRTNVKKEVKCEYNETELLLHIKRRRRDKPRKEDKIIENSNIDTIQIVEIKNEINFNEDANEEECKEYYNSESVDFGIQTDQELTGEYKEMNTDVEGSKIDKPSYKSKEKSLTKTEQMKAVKENETEYLNSDDFLDHKLVCCICDAPLADFRMLKLHYRNEHNTIGYAMCCGKRFFKRCLLIDHLRVHKDPNFFKCDLCSKTFATRRGLEIHTDTHKSQHIYKCVECGKSYSKLYIFERHKLTHVPENERNFKCSQCEKKFASDYIRRQHEDVTHSKKYVKICDICGKTFYHRDSFRRHMKKHAGISLSLETCGVCGVKLVDKAGLKRHMQMRHIAENLREQICPHCSKVSPNLNAHRKHIKFAHIMQRKYSCNLCEKAFKRPIGLKEHLSTHTGEALYTCPHCPKTFISNANMHKHRKIAHRQEWEKGRLKRYNERRQGLLKI